MTSETKNTTEARKGSTERDLAREDKVGIEDLEYSISMLRVKMESARSLPDKIRLYNQIKTLQANIDRLEGKRSLPPVKNTN